MKHLIMAAAAMTAGIALADVQSANIVGYQNLESYGCTYPSVAATFVPLSGEEEYRLGDMQLAGDADPEADWIQVLDPDTTEVTVTYAYCSAAFAEAAEKAQTKEPGTFAHWIGWWIIDEDEGEFNPNNPKLKADDEMIPVATAFLCVFADEVIFSWNGEVPQDPVEFASNGTVYPFFGNMIPRDLKLGWIKGGADIDPEADWFQVLDPDTTEVTVTYAYCSPEFAAAAEKAQTKAPGTFDYWIGWWIIDEDEGEFNPDNPDLVANDEDVLAGQCFLSVLADDVTIEFPSALYNGEDAE